ncbi:MAG: hypothetical protein ACOCVF_00435 [bacterium]
MQENYFKLGLYQEDVVFFEGIFSSDVFNPLTKKNIDIRPILPDFIRSLQKMLSKRNYNFKLPVDKYDHYDNQHIVMNYLYSFDSSFGKMEFDYNPESKNKKIMGKVYTGVEFKLGFYVSDKTIVERDFYVNGFNPMSRYSVDITDLCTDILESIKEYIKIQDIINICDEIETAEYFS